jgi:hypothetical protein
MAAGHVELPPDRPAWILSRSGRAGRFKISELAKGIPRGAARNHLIIDLAPPDDYVVVSLRHLFFHSSRKVVGTFS